MSSQGDRPVLSSANPSDRRARLRAHVISRRPLVLPGATDAAGVMLVERAGFQGCYVTGAGVANAQFGLADIGLVSQTEVVQQLSRMVTATDLPLVVDTDTGYGGVPSVIRTVQLVERAGASALQLEDQVMPKRCGHFDGHDLISSSEMQAKIAAAVAARCDENLLVIARTDARSALGLSEALRRGQAYLDAGADVLFIEAPQSVQELDQIAAEFTGVPLVANVVEGGKTPALTVDELTGMGFSVLLFANFLMRAMLHAGKEALRHLAQTGETMSYADRLMSWQDRQEMFRLAELTAVEDMFLRGWSAR